MMAAHLLSGMRINSGETASTSLCMFLCVWIGGRETENKDRYLIHLESTINTL